MELKDLKKGDKFKIKFGDSIRRAKVIKNLPEEKVIYLKVGLLGWLGKMVRDYNDYNFENIDIYN